MTGSLVVLICMAAVCLPARLDAEPQQQNGNLGFSADEVIKKLKEAPSPAVTFDPQLPVATFRASVEQRRYMPTFEEWLQKEFALTDFQRQSQEWYSKCCWINLLDLPQWADKLDRPRRRRELRKLREHIARELAQIEANKKR